MNAYRRPFQFVDFIPYSVFIVETISSNEPRRNFDYFDCIIFQHKDYERHTLVITIRTNHFGVICVPNDNGHQKEVAQSFYDRFEGIPLHPLQFAELSCKAIYKHSLLSYRPLYHSVGERSRKAPVVVAMANGPVGYTWNTWSNEAFANLFWMATSCRGYPMPLPESMYSDNGVMTSLFTLDGKPQRMTEDAL